MVEIVWKGGAEQDLLQIFSGLEDVREGAGAVFTRMLDTSLQNLRLFPYLAPVFDTPMRRLVIGNSGYGLFYTVELRGIIVHALIHLSQSPEVILVNIRKAFNLQ